MKPARRSTREIRPALTSAWAQAEDTRTVERGIRKWLTETRPDLTGEAFEYVGAVTFLRLTGRCPRWGTPREFNALDFFEYDPRGTPGSALAESRLRITAKGQIG